MVLWGRFALRYELAASGFGVKVIGFGMSCPSELVLPALSNAEVSATEVDGHFFNYIANIVFDFCSVKEVFL